MHSQVKQELDSGGSGGPIDATKCDKPQTYWVKLVTSKAEKDAVGRCRYDQLMWVYCNYLVHQIRNPGYTFEDEHKAFSIYDTFTYLGTNRETYELQFLIKFLKCVFNNCLINLQEWLEEEKVDPYTRHQFGSLWLDQNDLKSMS